MTNLPRSGWRLPALLALLTLAPAAGCEGEAGPSPDGGTACEASEQSGMWLLPFGPLSQEINTAGEAKVTVVVTRRSASEDELSPVEGKAVQFKVITPGGDASLTAPSVTTNADGIASTTLRAGDREMVYQVEASSDATCQQTFTVDVRRPLRQLRAVTPSPFDTFTGSRVPVAVEATTNGNAKLSGEAIEFEITLGRSGQTRLVDPDGNGGGATLSLVTGADGRATAMVETGDAPIPQLKIEAAMAETAPVEVVLRVAEGQSSGCQGDEDCPLGYTCNQSSCEPPPPPPPTSTGCESDADCAAPTVCDTDSGKCLEPTGKPCDPIEGVGCDPGEVCVGRVCAKLPSGCKDHSDCPAGWICQGGACIPGGTPPTGGCTTNSDCPSGSACINGQCKPKTACNIPHAPDRLAGTWQYDSTLHLRDALNPVLGGLLSTAGVLRDIINGSFSISGIPSFISKLVTKYLGQLIGQYVPPWGQQLIVTLGNLNDVVDDMRVRSTVQTNSVGNDSYVNTEQWDLVEFTYNGQKISTPPSAIPEIGQVTIPAYSSTEVCGELFIQKHKVKNAVGGLIKWAIETTLSVVTCNSQSTPCFQSVGDALQQTINCMMLGMQLDQMVQSIWPGAPSVAGLVTQACEAEKNSLIQKLNSELAALTAKLSLLELSGTVKIPNPPGHNVLNGGKWFGVLGTSVAKGNFEGDFSAKRP